MVQIASRFFVLISCVALGLSTPLKRTIDQVKADVADISTKVTTLDNAINAFPMTGGTLLAALGIHSSATALVTTLATATTDVTATGPLEEQDGSDILNAVLAIEPIIGDALQQIVVKQPAFKVGWSALPIGGLPALILQDLKNLNDKTVSFSDALISTAPADLVDAATNLRDRVVNAFTAAIAAYT
ncbi:hydrophobic surface binding protein [Laccaria bicolor S238N-H82]|uniref:Hydrophobic surface binding protein n=1 Tax=Laccaria bicolor (strain S238N-H82 / ATCC MYA-4686) TaxID=486041 RepID=B0DFI2_LACBS|nr:hydrophobic surface binding protein [Laccaria bicolor S238N-H82]EDR06867.1 hydrophobic surface binding protein [Laccaria bicolor S238N-H82]|eukprot:XP_001882714.1 hydrophobic surface binding protein [Laccaria bicolor S238N-H82]